MLTESKRIAYRLLGGMVFLLVAHTAIALLAAVKFLPLDPLGNTIPYAQLGASANVLLELAITSGLLAGGLYMVAAERVDGEVAERRALRYGAHLWAAWALLGVGACFLGALEGRYGLELPPALDAARVVLLVGWVALVWPSAQGEIRPMVSVWSAGLLLSALCALLGLLPPSDYVADRLLRTLAVGLNSHVAYVVSGVALAFWCMRRFSNISPLWAEWGLYTTCGLLALAGARVAIAPLYPFGAEGPLLSAVLLLVPLAVAIFAGHSYRALSDRNGTATLSAHWTALGVLCLIIGVGVVGFFISWPTVQPYIQGTRLSDWQMSLTLYGVAAFLLATNNQASAELRGHNQRVTGLVPFWLVSFGLLIGGGGLLAAGVAQVYMERYLSVGYLDTQRAITPLYLIWIGGWLSVHVGVGIYALGWRARRPQSP